MRKSTVNIDGEKLRKMITSRGLSLTDVSEELGFHETWLSRCLNGNYLTKIAIRGIELRYGIRGEDYLVPEPKPEPEPEPEPKQIELVPDHGETVMDYEKLADTLRDKIFDYQKIYATVYKAVYEALKKVRME